MNILRVFGFGSHRILACNCCTKGQVIRVRTSLLHVEKKPVRLYPHSGNARYSHYIIFSYSVNGIPYKGCLYVDLRYRCPQQGESIEVYYDSQKPQNYACYSFGPGVEPIGW